MAMIKRLFCFLLALTLVLSGSFMSSGAVSKQEELQQQYNELERQLAANRKKLNELESNKKKQKEYVKTLSNQSAAIQRQSEVIRAQISEKEAEKSALENQIQNYNNKIKELDDEAQKMQTEIEKTYELLKKRMRAIYIAGGTAQIQLLLDSENIETLLTRTELLRSVAKHDRALVNELVSEIEKLEEKRREIEEKKQKLTEQKALLEENARELKESASALSKKEQEVLASKADTIKVISDLDKSSDAYIAARDALEREQERVDRELQKEIEALPPDVTEPGGGSGGSSNQKYLEWPVPGFRKITSEFGLRDAFGFKFHYGIDIAGNGINGKKIVAAESGTVVKSTVDSAYGNYILINHGNGKLTRYCHCSKLVVKAGQYVRRGQKIAEVGSTGNSTGPHLHFEVYINNKRENPRKYLNPKDF